MAGWHGTGISSLRGHWTTPKERIVKSPYENRPKERRDIPPTRPGQQPPERRAPAPDRPDLEDPRRSDPQRRTEERPDPRRDPSRDKDHVL